MFQRVSAGMPVSLTWAAGAAINWGWQGGELPFRLQTPVDRLQVLRPSCGYGGLAANSIGGYLTTVLVFSQLLDTYSNVVWANAVCIYYF